MNATEGTALLRLIEQRVEAEVGPLRKRISKLENEVRTLRASEPRRPGILGRLTEALTGGSHD